MKYLIITALFLALAGCSSPNSIAGHSEDAVHNSAVEQLIP